LAICQKQAGFIRLLDMSHPFSTVLFNCSKLINL